MLIYLIRHGETIFNAENRYQGSLDVPLSERGRRKLRRADFCPTVVYTSPLRRTKETAAILFPQARQIAVSELREMSFGVFEGRSREELAEDEQHRIWLTTGFTGSCPGETETHPQFVRRTCNAFAALVDEALDKGEERLVIVAHGGTQMAVLSAYTSDPREFSQWLTGNGGGYVLDTARWKDEHILIPVSAVDYGQQEK